MDRLSPLQRHNNMAAIRSKDTKPEMVVRRYLWSRGFRYRLNHKRLPGHPDIVLRRYRTCIFVNGCFWHGHNVTQSRVQGSSSCSLHSLVQDALLVQGFKGSKVVSSECCKIPKTNRDFWVKKITRNMERDREEQRRLASMGWHCITVWECDLKPAKREQTLRSLVHTLNSIFLKDRTIIPYPKPEEEQQMAAEEGI